MLRVHSSILKRVISRKQVDGNKLHGASGDVVPLALKVAVKRCPLPDNHISRAPVYYTHAICWYSSLELLANWAIAWPLPHLNATPLPLDKAVEGIDAVICAYSPNPILDLDGHLLLLRAAERAGVKIFVASSWNCDWTKIKYGDFEPYDNHIAFEQQAAMTSSIRPVYLFTGVFHSLLFTPFGPGGFDTADGVPRMHYWGDGDQIKHPWSHLNDVAAWTIEILINGDGVRDGNGGFFSLRSGRHTIRELARTYQEVTGTEVQVIRQGNLEDLKNHIGP
ncbi:hypothetical protein S40285_02746 [Stachybotrys chlorohalonatus IBT 40285]|uniref:NmrA-like domain-containing protein n=1 Tax=Stachybotrys chlorohalonatus (strain IBT 40285) TaxID=1283841 RepID=A0A084QAM7_STAC4|nr:hypothetical protein S40285_02746 [Stachybotrys chlorohalonata IBT 40285]